MILDHPNAIPRTGDDRPAPGLYAFVRRMTGWRQVLPVALALLTALLGVVPVDLQRRMIDDAVQPGDMDLLMLLAGLYLGTIVVSGVVKLALRMVEGWLSESAIRYCRLHLAGLMVSRHADRGDDSEDRGTAVSILRAEIEQVGGFAGAALSEPAAQAGVLIAMLGYMLWIEPVIALGSLAFLLPQVLVTTRVQVRINRLTDRRIELLRALSAEIPLLGSMQDDAPGTQYKRTTSGLFRNRMRLYAWKFAGKAATNLLNQLAPLAVLVIGGAMVIRGETALGVVVAFTTGFARLADPLRALIAYYRLAARTSVQHRKIAEWM